MTPEDEVDALRRELRQDFVAALKNYAVQHVYPTIGRLRDLGFGTDVAIDALLDDLVNAVRECRSSLRERWGYE